MAFQTRSEVNGLNVFDTFIEAFNASKADKTIWKISFDDADGTDMRWRPKTKNDVWGNEDCLENLSPEYAMEQNLGRVFWVWQTICPDMEYMEELMQKEEAGEITNAEADKMMERANIKCVLTEEEFVNRFRMI